MALVMYDNRHRYTEQDNEKFISSEDLLGDFKEERNPASDSQTSNKTNPQSKSSSAMPATDLDNEDDEEDFVQAEIPTKQPEQRITAPVLQPTLAPIAKLAPVEPEPFKPQLPVPDVKKEAPIPVAVDTKPKIAKAQQPNIVSVEIFSINMV
ncbi:hypothetical protein EVAR_68162_1 [Eumeta japonica]|uniref:Uncharacterized protein n=1 Tax=Eumeta variegata TaxID=151549 RepID=A0A4C1TGP5_EUMVA|nr:hypothetical protein EVAR_68162_1 [Eumeta japonica]